MDINSEAHGMMADEDPEVRRQAVLSLMESKGAEAVPLLLGAIWDRDWRVRKTAVDALLGRGVDEVFEGRVRVANVHKTTAELLLKLGAAPLKLKTSDAAASGAAPANAAQ